jgi:diketogulonate reductase-like aldo/keto reductase
MATLFGEQGSLDVAKAAAKAQGIIRAFVGQSGLDLGWIESGTLCVATHPSHGAGASCAQRMHRKRDARPDGCRACWRRCRKRSACASAHVEDTMMTNTSATNTTAADAPRLHLPVIGLGTWQSQHDEGVRAVRTAIEMGYRHIDAAPRYQNEAAVGEGIRQSGIDRDALFVTTKVWWTELHAPALRRSVERSLSDMKLDYVDLLLIHWPNPDIPLDETLGALAEAHRQGLARSVGVSNFPVTWLDRAVALSPVRLSVNQCEYHPYLNQRKVLDACARHAMTFVAHTPLGSGRMLDDPLIAKIAARHGKTPSQILLRWLIQQPGVAAVPKSTNAQRIGENIDVFDFALDDNDMRRISELARPDGRISKVAWAPEWDSE